MMISYAQNFEDVLLQRSLSDIAQGFYVDIGAHHPEIDSVTKWFYDQGWSGINVEPVPHLHRLLQTGRPRDTNLAVAAGATAGRATLQVFPESPGLSTLNPDIASHAGLPFQEIEVEVRPLRDILADMGDRPIHFLKIDVEGAERDVLLGMDFQRFRPWVLVIETAPPDGKGPAGPDWDDLVLPFGYRFAWFDGLNRFFIAEEHLDRLPRLAMPPHVFDHFELAMTLQEREGREAAEAGLAKAREEIDRRDTRVKELDTALADSQREAEALRQRSEGLLARLDAAEAKEAAMQAQIEEATRLRLDMERAAAALQAQLDEAAYQLELFALAQRHAAVAQRDLEVSREETRLLQEKANQLEETIDQYLRSSSWRYTAPLRAARRLAGQLSARS